MIITYNSEGCKYQRTREKEMNNDKDRVICVFCMRVIAQKMDFTQTMVCELCQEYKGITTIREYEAEYEETLVIA